VQSLGSRRASTFFAQTVPLLPFKSNLSSIPALSRR
jgi:hypothetical protein